MLEATGLNAYMNTTKKTKSKRQSFQLGFQTQNNSNWLIYVQFECVTGERVRKHKHVYQENITLCLWTFTHNKKKCT